MRRSSVRAKATNLGVLLVLSFSAIQSAKADYVFGVAEKLGAPVNSPNPSDYEWWPRLHADGLSLVVLRGLDEGQEVWQFARASKQDAWQTAIQIDVDDTSQLGGGGPATFMPGAMTMDGLECYGMWYIAPEGYGDMDLYFLKRDTIDSPWSEVMNVGPPVNTKYSEAHSVISPDGLELLFSDQGFPRPGGHGGEDIWVARRAMRTDPWPEPENLGPVVNSPSNDSRAHISLDGLLLFFDSRRPGGYGSSDLYVTRRMTLSDPWEEPVNLGQNVNSAGDEFGPGISPDGRELYLVRNKDIWRASVEPTVDFDGDGVVDGVDINIMVDFWGTDEPLCDIGPMPWGDGVVDVQDLIVLVEHMVEAKAAPVEPEAVNVNEADDGGQVGLEVGQILTVTLDANPTTGYGWEQVADQESILEQIGEPEFKPSDTGEPPVVGAGGWEILRFEATGAGQMTLQLVYHRSWEEDVEPLQTFSIQVLVQ